MNWYLQQRYIKQIQIIKYLLQYMKDQKEQVRDLYPGIKIRKKKVVVDQQLSYLFFLDVQDLKIIDFEADFTGSQNISIKGFAQHQRIVIKTVEPRQIMLIAQVELHQGWKLKTKFRFLRKPIPKQKQLQYIEPQIASINTQTKMVDTILKNMQIGLTSVEDITQLLIKSKVKFIDKQFLPQQTSIVGKSDKSLIDDTVNHWRRPQHLFEGKEYSFIDRFNYKDLKRGKLGDNAVFSVICALCVCNVSLIQRLFIGNKDINPAGVYRLKLCKNGQWQTVTIDDFIPCQPLAGPKFISSGLNDIWVMLLEKAYAKLHKRYLSLHELQVSNVFIDFTGCPTYIQPTTSKKAISKILEALKQHYIVCFYNIQQRQFQDDEFVPLRNYAYVILNEEQEDGKHYFTYISHNNKQQEIGEDQFAKIFNYICICKVANWEQVRVKGKFVTVQAGQPPEHSMALAMSRWYYSIDLTQATQMHFCLHQQDLLIGNNSLYKDYLYVSLLLLQKSEKSILKHNYIMNYAHNRQIQFQAKLQPGYYLIIPFVNSQVKIKHQEQQDTVLDIFKKLDLLMHRQLKYAEFLSFYKVMNQVFDQNTFTDLLNKYAPAKKGIGKQGFMKLCNDNKITWSKQMQYYDTERLFTFSVHSKIQTNILIKSNIGTQFNNRAHCQLIQLKGQELHLNTHLQARTLRIKLLKSKCQIIQYMAQNKSDTKIQFTIDCTQSSGYNFVPSSGKLTCSLDSGQRQFVMKLVPMQKIQYKDLVKKQRISVKVFQ